MKILIDSAHRDTDKWPRPSRFRVDVPPIQDVARLRLLQASVLNSVPTVNDKNKRAVLIAEHTEPVEHKLTLSEGFTDIDGLCDKLQQALDTTGEDVTVTCDGYRLSFNAEVPIRFKLGRYQKFARLTGLTRGDGVDDASDSFEAAAPVQLLVPRYYRIKIDELRRTAALSEFIILNDEPSTYAVVPDDVVDIDQPRSIEHLSGLTVTVVDEDGDELPLTHDIAMVLEVT